MSLWRKRAGNMPDEVKQDMENKGAIVIGNYALWNLNDDDAFGSRSYRQERWAVSSR